MYIYILRISRYSVCPHPPLFRVSCLRTEMASQRFGNFPPSPNKKSKAKRSRSKRRSDDDADNSRVKTKRSKDPVSVTVADGNEAARPKRSGAGSGGRVTQLEKIGMALGKPLAAARSRQVTDLAEDLPDNPLAPPKKQKRRKAKVRLW
jgi:hypothetical protein